ncbi:MULTISPECIES: hypothetical protein [unclassified Neisseria]|uniref:hypothetical protein n=1 Tax=unclassified Neisseria TaxID=2623750 RepID=UPI002666F152|nr:MULTISPECIES: hypothetical protein [unclassified Neisseria]MDO1510982.1 hypothetical protein [Neisseria sp. MVDL19-042950]MDO1517241.1 hypothetical protein [Neisseria sp. MVDL18-041461]MDO1564604.1 hypothetical protein [Neisseria sp. MVDL20-010259]
MKKTFLILIGLPVLLALSGFLIYFYYDEHRVSLAQYSDLNKNFQCYADTGSKGKDWIKGGKPYQLLICREKEKKNSYVFVLENPLTKQQYKAVKVRGELQISKTYYGIAAVEILFYLFDKDDSFQIICFPYPTYPTFEEWKPFARKHEGGTDKKLKEKYEFILARDLKCRNDRI